MGYLQYTFTGIIDEQISELLIACLSGLKFQGFTEEQGLIIAYSSELIPDNAIEKALKQLPGARSQYTWQVKTLENINWNEAWEKSFHPIHIEGRVYVRAPFHHEDAGSDYQVIISPKMSFGTGHHSTTRLMISALLDMDLSGQKVLDMGCGTGILSIFAAMKGAKEVLGLDTDEWSIANARENTALNGTQTVRIEDRSQCNWQEDRYHLVLANINRNVLLIDLPAYENVMLSGGTLIISGFLKNDLDILHQNAASVGLQKRATLNEHDWFGMVFVKP